MQGLIYVPFQWILCSRPLREMRWKRFRGDDVGNVASMRSECDCDGMRRFLARVDDALADVQGLQGIIVRGLLPCLP